MTATAGLSPRVRGSLWPPVARAVPAGSIPAGAGEPPAPPLLPVPRWVYPRGCEGAPETAGARISGKGLSPRVRGSPLEARQKLWDEGSIPAGAGEPGRERLPSFPWRVYPRGCGGAAAISEWERGVKGLSPRVRGSLLDEGRDGFTVGSIPAGAGEPVTSRGHRSGPRVYPRGCGGAAFPLARADLNRGLSPRVRGSPAQNVKRGRLRGSIPAGAGEPGSLIFTFASFRVYPRGCGGASATRSDGATSRGLSPRVRGSPHRQPPLECA